MNNKHPNIIYILADDMGYGDLSCLNEESKIHTQHLDELAAGGMVFTDAHASSAVCTPSRYSIMTGRYNWRSALKQGVTWGYSKPLLEAGRTTVASYLQGQGYHTACIGKWHLGLGWVFHEERPADALDDIDYTKAIADGPTTSGFDYYFGIPASLDMQPYVYVENDRVTAIPDRIIPGRDDKEMWREGPIAPDFAHEEVLPKLTEKAVAYVEERAASDQPFFLYYPLPAPHTPILPTAEFQGKSGTNEYGDFCLQVDDLIGQLMAVLEKHGLTENTIFVFTSDNGCSPRADFDELAAVGHRPSYHFRGHKADIYEGGHRIPLVVRWPQTIAAGTASHETVCLVDLIATCADVVGDVLPANVGEDSVSNLPAWRGESIPTSLREATVHSSVN
ncbi:MAG: arylsulfatase, partial [Chloroflexota bacterium]